jgi:hypothetical protein
MDSPNSESEGEEWLQGEEEARPAGQSEKWGEKVRIELVSGATGAGRGRGVGWVGWGWGNTRNREARVVRRDGRHVALLPVLGRGVGYSLST